MADLELCFLGVGTNLGDRVQNIINARKQIEADDVCCSLRCSSLYWTSPLGYLAQPAFLNCVFQIETRATPSAVHTMTRTIEERAGRQRDPDNQNAPRIIDIDILLFGEREMMTDELTIPHPRMFERRFVLEPLLELQPALRMAGESIAETYELRAKQGVFDGQDVFKLGN
jgi:2-amino-4-hydroxy-6-hydroxymethyldihydropteridine diphosphokinase